MDEYSPTVDIQITKSTDQVQIAFLIVGNKPLVGVQASDRHIVRAMCDLCGICVKD
jgi:hypothetical protein